MSPAPARSAAPDAEFRRTVQNLIWAVEARDAVAVIDLSDYLVAMFNQRKA